MYTSSGDTLSNTVFEHSDDQANYVSEFHLRIPLLWWEKLEYSKFNYKLTAVLICFITQLILKIIF